MLRVIFSKTDPGKIFFRPKTIHVLLFAMLLLGQPAIAQIQKTETGIPDEAALVIDERLVPLVEVNADTISLGVFKKSYVDYLIASGANDTRENRYRHLQAIIDAYLLGNYARTLRVVEDSLFEAFVTQKELDAIGGRYYELHVLDQMEELTTAEKRRAYAFSKDRVHVRQLYFRRLADAQQAHQRLLAGEDFIDLANELYQTAAYDTSAGDMGLVSYFEIDDALAEAAFGLTERYAYTAPVQSRNGFHILRLENRYRNPILTESEYQAHGPGVGEEMQLRKIRIFGDAFVRAFMTDLQYEVQTEAVNSLSWRIRAMVSGDAPESITIGNSEQNNLVQLAEIRQFLTPESILVTYVWQGRQKNFTAADYYRWLPDLPYDELKRNPPASIGRALRNEVFGLAGIAEGLAADPIVRASVDYETQVFLSGALKTKLRQDTTARPTENLIRQAYERIVNHRDKAIHVDYWAIPCNDLESARELLALLEGEETDPEIIDGYMRFTNFDIAENPVWQGYLRQAPLAQPMIVGLQEGNWAVFEVQKRNTETYEIEDVRAVLEEQLAPYAGEYNILRTLYERANIVVDTMLVEQLVTN